MGIRIIVTGGTFDKTYDPLKGNLGFDGTHLAEILEQARCRAAVHVEVNRLVDSLDMSDADRKAVLAAVRDCSEQQVMVTHGTDTMVETARVIGEASLPKTVVLTGAMVPHALSGSDALFNLGCAFVAVQLLPTGTYVAMNGRVFPWDDVRKNREAGVFEPIDAPR
jgi:L-asparaginase